MVLFNFYPWLPVTEMAAYSLMRIFILLPTVNSVRRIDIASQLIVHRHTFLGFVTWLAPYMIFLTFWVFCWGHIIIFIKFAQKLMGSVNSKRKGVSRWFRQEGSKNNVIDPLISVIFLSEYMVLTDSCGTQATNYSSSFFISFFLQVW